MFSEDYEEVRMQEKISTIAARGCVERWLIQVCDHNIFTGTNSNRIYNGMQPVSRL